MERPWLKSYEKEVPSTIPYPKIPLFKLLTDSARRFPAKTATIFYGNRITYEQLDELTNRFAHALTRLGVRKGDLVAITAGLPLNQPGTTNMITVKTVD